MRPVISRGDTGKPLVRMLPGMDPPPRGPFGLRRVPLERRKVADRRQVTRSSRLLLGLVGVVLVLGLWQLLYETHIVNRLIWSSPSAIWSAFLALVRSGQLGTECVATAELFLWSFVISLVVGLILGVVLGWYQRAHALIDPWVLMLYAAPRIALVPLIIAAEGVGFRTQVIVTFTIAVFPIIINVAAGVAAVDRDHLRVARSFLATNWDVLRGVALPGALPVIMVGIQQGLVMTLIGVVVAEYFVGTNGLGGLIVDASQSIDTASAFVGAIIFALASVVLTALLRFANRRISKWSRS